MARKTSIQSYNQIKQDGLLNKQRFQIYEWLYKYGPSTAGVISKNIHGNRNNIATRLTELRHLGVVEELGVQQDVSGKDAILWDVTSKLPYGKIIMEIQPTRKQLLKENENLKDLLSKALIKIDELKNR